jgi:uncharacterized protein (DUF305 family)
MPDESRANLRERSAARLAGPPPYDPAMSFRRRLLVPALLAAVPLAGCDGLGGNVMGHADPVNGTDAAFVRAMIEHERAVGSIARLGRKKALRVELRGIAKDRLARQGRNLGNLGWFDKALRDRRVSPLGARIRRGPPPHDPRALRRAVSFDHEFLRVMIEQHEYAMATAAVERDRGGDPRLRALAKKIHASSQRDLATLRRWLRTWYGDDTQRGTPPGPPLGPGGGGGGGGSPGPAPEV